MAVADALVDFKFARSIRDEKKRKSKNKGKENQQKEDKKNNHKRKKDGGVKTFTKGETSQQGKGQKNSGFYICNGPRRVREYQKHEKLNVIVVDDDKKHLDGEVPSCVNSS